MSAISNGSTLVSSGVVNFGARSDDYATFRPGFPPRFFDRLVTTITEFRAAQTQKHAAPKTASAATATAASAAAAAAAAAADTKSASGGGSGSGPPSAPWDWKGKYVLDIGTGPGIIALELAARGAKVVGLDIAANQIAAAQKRATELKLESLTQFAVGTAEQTGQATGVFDLVLAGQCWPWFKQPDAMKELKRVMKPNGEGVLVIGQFCYLPARSPLAADSEAIVLDMNPKWTMAGFDGLYPKQIDQLVVSGGFELIEQFTFDHPQYFTHAGWCGRMRTCNGVGSGGLDEAGVVEFDQRLQKLLKQKYPAEPQLMAPKKRVPAAPDEGKPGPNKRVKPTAAATGVDAGSARDDQLQSLFGPRKRQLFRLLSEAVPSFAYDILTVVISYDVKYRMYGLTSAGELFLWSFDQAQMTIDGGYALVGSARTFSDAVFISISSDERMISVAEYSFSPHLKLLQTATALDLNGGHVASFQSVESIDTVLLHRTASDDSDVAPIAVCSIPGNRLCAAIESSRQQTELVVYQLRPSDRVLTDVDRSRFPFDAPNRSGKIQTGTDSFTDRFRIRSSDSAAANKPRSLLERSGAESLFEASPFSQENMEQSNVPAQWRLPLVPATFTLNAKAMTALPPPYEHVVLCVNKSDQRLLLFDTVTCRDVGMSVAVATASFPLSGLVWCSLSGSLNPILAVVGFISIDFYQITPLSGSEPDTFRIEPLAQCIPDLMNPIVKACALPRSKRLVCTTKEGRLFIITADADTKTFRVAGLAVPCSDDEEKCDGLRAIIALPNDSVLTGERV